MILEALPDIPRFHTGLAEWVAVLIYVLIMRPRFTGARRIIVLAVSLPLMVGLQVFAGTWPLELWLLGIGTAVLSIFFLIYICADTSLYDAGYLAARAFVLAELVASLQWQLEVHYSANVLLGTPRGNLVADGILLCGEYSLGFGAAYLAERRNFTTRMRLGIDARTLIVSLAIASGTFLVSNLSFLTTNTPFSGQSGRDVFYIRTLVDLAGFVALYTQQSNRNLARDALELAKTQMLMKAQHQQYLQSKRNIEELNRMHHDLKHYAAAIRNEASADRRSDYLQALEDSIRGYESEIQTGNPVLDIVLSSKMERCLQEGISMTHVVDGAAVEFMDPIRLSAFFGNALDNAIEAALHVSDKDERIIKIVVYTQGEFVMISIENRFSGDITFTGGLPETTKNDRSRHGYGTVNMREIVTDYEGSMTMSVQEGWFKMKALIPSPDVAV
ncbi:MAG: ATP-binding protein [Ancrocorticia sp.]